MEPPVRLDHRKDLVTDMATGQAPKNWRSRQLITCLITGRQAGYRSNGPDTSLSSQEGQGQSPHSSQVGGGGVVRPIAMELRDLQQV